MITAPSLILAVITASSLISVAVTALALILAVVTASAFSLSVVTALLLIFDVVTVSFTIDNTPAFVNDISPDGTTGLKLVPSATNIDVSVFVPIVKSSPRIVKSPPIVTFPLESIVKSLLSAKLVPLLILNLLLSESSIPIVYFVVESCWSSIVTSPPESLLFTL